MARPIKEFSLGQIKCAVFEGELKGKKTYSFKFQKSYKGKDDQWKNTDFFYPTDLRDLYGLVGALLHRQVKERTPQQAPPPEPEPEEREPITDNTPEGEPDLPF